MQLFFVFAALFTASCAHDLSGRSGQEHLSFMQSQAPDVVVVHHNKGTTSRAPRKDSVVHHVKPSKTAAAAHQVTRMRQSSLSGPDPLSTGTWSKLRGGLWLASRVCIVLCILGLGVFIGFWRFGTNPTVSEFISSIPAVSSPAEMHLGTWVKVIGTVAPVDGDAPLKSILEDRSCVFNEASADVPESGVTVARFEATCDLQIISDSGNADLGPVLVHAADSAVLVPKPVLDAMYVRKLMPPDFEDFVKSCPTPGHSGEESLALHALQFQERILEVNARVAVVGVVSSSSCGKICLVPDTVAHLQKTQGCRNAFRRHMRSLLSYADAQFMSSHVLVVDATKSVDLEQ